MLNALRQPHPKLDSLEAYDPKYLPARHYLNANENPYDLPAPVKSALTERFASLNVNRYPAPLADELRQLLARHFALSEQEVLLGNGGDELLLNLSIAYGGAGRRLLTSPPTFSVYATNALLTDTELLEVPRRADKTLDREAFLAKIASDDPDLLILTSPNNPTGECLDEGFIRSVLEASDALLVLDQAYVEFACSRFELSGLLGEYRNLVILRTFSKAYGLAGMRLGYVLAAPEVTANLIKVRQPYSVDAFAALCGAEVMRQRELFDVQIAAIKSEREVLRSRLAAVDGFRVYPSDANFLLVDVSSRIDPHQLWLRLYEEHAVLLRDMSAAPGLSGCLRVSVGTAEDTQALSDAIAEILKER